MDTFHTPAFTHVDYARAINNLVHVAKSTIPEIKLRNKSAGWVLCHRQSRVRQAIFTPPTVRMYNLPQAELKPAELYGIHKEALVEFQLLNTYLISGKVMPAVKVPKIIDVLSRYPVINVRQMAEFAGVSEATSKRWLRLMVDQFLVGVQYVNGQNQYQVTPLLKIIDWYAK